MAESQIGIIDYLERLQDIQRTKQFENRRQDDYQRFGKIAANYRKCPCCPHVVHRFTINCPYCGKYLGVDEEIKICSVCGKRVKVSAENCPHCQHRFMVAAK